MPAPLSCTVRTCGRPLERRGQTFACDAGHSFDIARRGYVNLLQPQDRKSANAGDSSESVEARSSLLAAGIGRPALDAMVEQARNLQLEPHAAVVDLGSGSGELLGELVAATGTDGIGIDLSTAAAERAARRYPDLTWVVANADRRLPLLAASVALIVSLNARRNPAECARILRPGGALLIGAPGPDDLIELRAFVAGEARERERGDTIRAEHEPFFNLRSADVVRTTHHLDRAQLLALLRGTYRGARRSATGRVDTMEPMEVTIATELYCFVPANTSYVPGSSSE
jgi:23S rRNA (guanine745-N1)-methyltransferase